MNEVQEFNDFELLNHFNTTCKVNFIIQKGFYTFLLSNYEIFMIVVRYIEKGKLSIFHHLAM